jgi:hypothetical protein
VITEIEEIDAETAEKYLESNPTFETGRRGTNRPISWVKVNQYARDMLRGNWMLTHQGIAFDTSDKMRDGQHRMWAVYQAATEGARDGETVLPPNPKISVKFSVTRGLDPKTFDVIDTGRARTSGQILAMQGYNNSIQLAAAARLLYLFDNHEYSQWRTVKVTNHTVLETVKKHKLDNFLTVGTSLFEVGFINSAVLVGYYVCNRAMPNGPLNEYMEGLKTGESLRAEDPRLVLRNYMIKSKSLGLDYRRDSALHLALFIKSWNDFVNKRRRSQVSWRSGKESFPRPVE